MRRDGRFPKRLIRWTILSICLGFALLNLTTISQQLASKGTIEFRQGNNARPLNYRARRAVLTRPLRTLPTSLPNAATFDLLVLPLPQAGSSKIAFTSNRDGSAQIYLMNTDGSGQTRLTYDSSNDDYPRWSPSGVKILFQSDRDNPSTGYMDIYVMNSDGSGVTRLTTDANDDSMATWSLGGTKIVFQSMRNGVNYQVYSMNADGSNQVNLTNTSSSDGEPSWSPDGSKIVFASDRDHTGFDSVYVMNSDGANQQRITFSSGNVEDTQPMWSQDGSRIAFVSTRDSTVETWQETDDDGNLITRTRLNINKEVYVMNADGSGQTRLTTELANDDSPSWSPDGSKIVFRSDRERDCCDPSAQVWTMNADGTGQVNISNSGNGDYSASWTNDDFVASPLAGYRSDQPPVANAGGPYIAQSGEVVQLNASGSFDPNGTIVSYSWNFGDGTSGSGPIVNHQYSASGVYSVTLSVSDNSGSTVSSLGSVTVDSVAFPVKINFDELPNNTVVADQYLSKYGVRFFTDNSLSPVHTWQICGGFCSTTSLPNYIWTYPNITGQTVVEFTQPASNLTFYIIGIDVFFDQFAILDVYRNNSLYGSFQIFGNGTTTRQISLGSLDNINKIVIRGITDPAGIGFDDFSFNVPADVKITSERVGGYLNGTTQNALLGADVALNASPLPGAFAGGTYNWTLTGPATFVSTDTHSSSITIRSTAVSTEPGQGPITVNVSYTKNGLTASGSVTIKSILPTLTSFTGQQGPDLVTAPNICASPESEPPWWFYRLGCGSSSPAMNFTAQVHAPTFISEPSQSGVKYVQAISAFEKYTQRGMRCVTHRNSETNVDSGWQLDTSDPANLPGYPIHRFNESNDLTTLMVDAPKQPLTGISSWEFRDNAYIDDQFLMYLVYFVGSDPANPSIQRPIGQLRWTWGGTIAFDWIDSLNQGVFNLRRTTTGYSVGGPTSTMVAMNGNIKPVVEISCPGGPGLTNNKIDSTRFFVRRHYLDFLGREPDDSGWDFWTNQISQCGFDLSCIHSGRIHIGLAFFYSSEFILTDPEMANPPGTPDFNPAVYNRKFVYWCYQKYLRRDPHDDPVGWQFWTDDLNSNGNYAHTIDAFQVSDEYRNRLGNN